MASPVFLLSLFALSAEARDHSTVLWDETHGLYNSYSATTNYSDFADRMVAAGYDVDVTTTGVLTEDLDDLGVLIINITAVFTNAYSTAEADAIEEFVYDGGGLLIVTETPAATWGSSLSAVTSAMGV